MIPVEIDVYFLGAWLVLFNLAVLWFLLLPARIAARIAWRLLVAVWCGAMWAVYVIRARRHPDRRHGA